MTTTRPESQTWADETGRDVVFDVRPPATVNRLIVHQMDAARPSPGGIDSCLRGLLRYSPQGTTIAVVGVDVGGVPGRRIGRWELHRWGNRSAWFLPVANLDPGNQRRRVPHSVRLVTGLVRFRSRLPRAEVVQAHRADVAAAARAILRRPLAYFVHNQASGLTGQTSDSFWRWLGSTHEQLELRLVRGAREVVVFNEGYADELRSVNAMTQFSPTWYDPELVQFRPTAADLHRIVWVGRLEAPKDPVLAVRAFERLTQLAPDEPWSLDMVGDGTLMGDLEREVAKLPSDVRRRVRLLGRLAPRDVAEAMAGSGVFLMTSHPGYEGFPRVLVEAMATGLPAVVTEGSDTGSLVVGGHNGFVCGRGTDELARGVERAVDLERAAAQSSVEAFSAPHLVAGIFGVTSG
ncbi:MAG: glycosyltransferase [Actinomycetota bacterium]|nr:glycosyltransferase [Actinomycetota bacterium]